MALKGINKKNSILLIIDIVNFCAHPKFEIKKYGITFNKIRKMVPKLIKFIEAYKQKGGEVIYVNCAKWDKKHLPKNIVELYTDHKCRYYTKDKTEFPEEFYTVRPQKNDTIITKNSYDAFTNPKLDKLLKKKKINYLIVAGIFGDGCVHATIQGGFSKGYNFIILKDLIETTDVEHRQKMQKLMKKNLWPGMFGKTITSQEFLKN
jgi:nicotinamidase-related amidase